MSKKNIKVETNEFDEAIEVSKSFVEKNIKPLGYGIGAILVVVIGVLLIHQFYIVPNNNKADEALYAAQQLFADGNYEKALNGEGETKGFLAVADEYSCTKAGNLATLYAAICYAQTEKYQEAVDILEDYDGCGDEMVSPSAIGLLGNCYAELGQNEKAVELLLKAANKADNNILSPMYLVQAGQIYESLNQPEKALECYKKVKENYVQSVQYTEIEKYIERVSK
ncbi:MAG: tol-pal system YbgF family protein [Bacteroidaceae bacterium]